MPSLLDRVETALTAGAKGAADSILSPQPSPSAPAAAPAPSGIYTPTPSGLPSWALPAAGAVLVVFLMSRR